MAAGTDNVKIVSPVTILGIAYVIWRFTIAAMVLIVEARMRNTAVAIWTRWERSLTSLNLLEQIGCLYDSASCSY